MMRGTRPATTRRLLCLGEGASAHEITTWLDQRLDDFDELLFAQGGVTAHYVAIWARDGRNVPMVTLPSNASGLELVREALDAASFLYPLPRVMVWGDVRCFVEGRRVAEQDVPQAVIVDDVRRYGLAGWGWLGDGAAGF